METKEVVNLRKLHEEFYLDDSMTCDECPFRAVCAVHFKSNRCLVAKILGIEFKDMYDIEREQESKVEKIDE